MIVAFQALFVISLVVHHLFLLFSSNSHAASSALSLFAVERVLNGIADILGGAILLIIGILIIVLLVAAAIVLLPAIIVAVIVWFLTGSFLYAGIAFLVVALISLVAM